MIANTENIFLQKIIVAEVLWPSLSSYIHSSFQPLYTVHDVIYVP